MTTIEKSTFAFLKKLKENNNRDWFTENKPQFQIEQNKTKEFYKTLMERLKLHDSIDAFKFFRIYRDVRFSKDKTPYKIHFSGSFSRATKRLSWWILGTK